MRQKLEREKQRKLEKQLAKEEKDKEYVKILRRQQKLLESQTERNELEYRRQREEVEREFRRREKEAAIKKREMAEEIAKARSVQLEEVVSKRQKQFSVTNFHFFFSLLHTFRNDNGQCKSLAMKRISKNLWTNYVSRRIVMKIVRNKSMKINTSIETKLWHKWRRREQNSVSWRRN